jgi:hypothetical protein
MRIRLLLVAAILVASVVQAAPPRERDGNYVILKGKDRALVAPRTPSPPYPAGYRIRRYEAAMRFRVYLNANGKIDDIKMLKFYGDPILGSYAFRKVRETFSFQPLILDGKPTPACLDFPVLFYISLGQGPVSGLVYRGVKPDQIIELYGK